MVWHFLLDLLSQISPEAPGSVFLCCLITTLGSLIGKLKLEAALEVSSTVALQSVGAEVRMSFCYVQFIIFPPHFLFYSRLVHCLSL